MCEEPSPSEPIWEGCHSSLCDLGRRIHCHEPQLHRPKTEWAGPFNLKGPWDHTHTYMQKTWKFSGMWLAPWGIHCLSCYLWGNF